jgi:hypothetical protein
VTFPVTVVSPAVLYNRSEGRAQEETAMNGKTAGKRGKWLVGALVVVAAVALLAAAFRVHVQNSFSTSSGPVGSAADQQAIAFATCMRGHGISNIPDPPPGDGVAVRVPKNGPVAQAVDACKHLAPSGRETTSVQITL